MSNSPLPKFIGVFVSFFIIWLLNDLILIDSCLDQGGKFEYRQGKCLLENGDIYQSGLEVPLIVLYVFIAFTVTFFVSRLINKLFNLDKKKTKE